MVPPGVGPDVPAFVPPDGIDVELPIPVLPAGPFRVPPRPPPNFGVWAKSLFTAEFLCGFPDPFRDPPRPPPNFGVWAKSLCGFPEEEDIVLPIFLSWFFIPSLCDCPPPVCTGVSVCGFRVGVVTTPCPDTPGLFL